MSFSASALTGIWCRILGRPMQFPIEREKYFGFVLQSRRMVQLSRDEVEQREAERMRPRLPMEGCTHEEAIARQA